ncbi:MAG: hypothetical protein AAGA48_41155 [Myxococcota bacterium]
MSFKRLEVDFQDENFEEALTSRIADPVWMLCRQWQVGEFHGEDAASPALVEAEAHWVPLAEVTNGSTTTPIGTVPLEAMVEREAITSGPASEAYRIDDGLTLVRRLREAHISESFIEALTTRYSITPPETDGGDAFGSARLRLIARRCVDPDLIRAVPPPLPEIAQFLAGAEATLATNVIVKWQTETEGLFVQAPEGSPPSWQPRRQEYAFQARATDANVSVDLTAPEYPGGRLDWYHFGVLPPADQSPFNPSGLETRRVRVLPTPLQYAGMPASRYWELEDGDVYFGDLAAGPEDLARSIVGYFAMVAGDDWFRIPMSIPTGTLVQVSRVRVLDNFDTNWHMIPSMAVQDHQSPGDRNWRWFELPGDDSVASGRAPWLMLVPTVDAVTAAAPLERVTFRRDEMANLAWGIERTIETWTGRPVERGNDITTGEGPSASDEWTYRLATEVPDHWLPLVPVLRQYPKTKLPDEMFLRRGRIAVVGGQSPQPRGRILEPEGPFYLYEEEIPYGGVTVSRRYEMARGRDGEVYVWVGRRKLPADGPLPRTPLRFDAMAGNGTGEAP